MNQRTFSLPREHGGYLTLAAATIAGFTVAASRNTALAVGALAIVAFFVRAPIEQLAIGRPARRDGFVLALLAIAGAAISVGLGQLSMPAAGGALLLAAAIVCGLTAARMTRAHRTPAFETVCMGALGASSGVIAVAGGAPLRVGAIIAVVLGTHTALAVPLVRTMVRKRERGHAREAELAALAALVAAAFITLALQAPAATVALVPRALHVMTRALPPRPMKPSAIGWRETGALALCLALLLTFGVR